MAPEKVQANMRATKHAAPMAGSLRGE